MAEEGLLIGIEFGPDALSEDHWEALKGMPAINAGLDPNADPAIMRAAEAFDLESPVDANDPESLEQANVLFGDLVNKGEGGQKRIVGWYPAPDGEAMMAELEVTREDGSTYRAPMTEGRGTEEDAIVKRIPLDDIVNHVNGVRMIRNGVLGGGEEFQQNASRLLSVLRGGNSGESWELEEHPRLGAIQRNTKTGEIKPVRPGAGSPYDQRGSSGGSYKPPSNIQEAEALVQRGVYDNFGDAYEAVRARAGQLDPREQSEDRIEAMRRRAEDLSAVVNGTSATMASEAELEAAKQELQQVTQEIRRAENELYNMPSAAGQGVQDPPPRQDGQRYPQEGDMVGNPDPSAGANEPAPPPQREHGQRPGPDRPQTPAQNGTPTADDILSKYL